MNSNELIDGLNEIRKFEDRGITDYFGEEKEPRHGTVNDDYCWQIDEAIAIIERTRIRETAKEPPTEEDGDENHRVLGYSYGYKDWTKQGVNHIGRCHELYPYWTCLPELPEVTP